MDLPDAITSLLGDFNKYDVTTTSELAFGGSARSASAFDMLVVASKREDFTAREMAYPLYFLNDEWTEVGAKMYDGNDKAILTGFKLMADGSNQ